MKSPSRYLNEYLRKTTPTHAHIKKWAHAATVASAALIVPSLCAIYFRHTGFQENEPYWVWASMMMWKIHAVVILMTVLLWILEKPRFTKYLPVESIEHDLSTEENDDGSDGGNRPKPWLLLGFAALGFGFLWLAYREIVSLSDAMRWRGFLAAGGLRAALNAALFLLLAAGSLIGPLIFVWTVLKDKGAKKLR